MNSKIIDMDEALALVEDGSHIAFGGQPMAAKPMAFVSALARSGRRNLELTALFGSFDFEALAAAGLVRRTRSSYIGLEHYGPARAHTEAVASGHLEHLELSEYMIMRGFDAAGHGLPFLPTYAARGSDLIGELGLKTITCPYTAEELLAVPAIRPDLAVIHAERADEDGNVIGPELPSFLWDHDRTVARAAKRVVVTVERICGRDEVITNAGRTLLAGFEVDAVVETPDGARPTAFPGLYEADREQLADHV